MYLKFTNKNTKGLNETIVFDDYERNNDEGAKGAWVEMCPRCREKYADILGSRVDVGGTAPGFCYVHGCRKEANYYVDFAIDEITFEKTCGGKPASTIKKVSGKKLAEFLFDNLTPGKAFSFYEAEEDGKLINERIVTMVSVFDKPIIVASARFGGEQIYTHSGNDKEIFCREFKDLYLNDSVDVDFRNLWLDTEPFLPCTYDPCVSDETGKYRRDCNPEALTRIGRQNFIDFIVDKAEDGIAYDFQIEGTMQWQRCMRIYPGYTKILLHDYGYDGDCTRGREINHFAPDTCKEWFKLRLNSHGVRDILVTPALGELIKAHTEKEMEKAKDATPENPDVWQSKSERDAELEQSQYKYAVVCYSVHEKRIASCDPFLTEAEAEEFLRKDAQNTYEEEVENAGKDDRDSITLDTDEGCPIKLTHNEFVWTWEIIRIKQNGKSDERCKSQERQPGTSSKLNTVIYAKTQINCLPASCTECKMGQKYGFVGDIYCHVLRKYFTGNVEPPYKERPDECPLVEMEGFSC